MGWQTVIHSSRGYNGTYCILPGSSATFADSGWDTATLRVAQQSSEPYFDKGAPHPLFAGMYATGVSHEGPWHAEIYLYTVEFAGLIGGAQGMTTRVEIEGANRTERQINATEYFKDGNPGYGSSDRPLFSYNGLAADALRFISMQPFVEREFITTYAPPSMYSLEALKLGSKVLSVAPPTAIDVQTGIHLIANVPSGMLCSSVTWEKHPSQVVNLWLLRQRWEAVPARDSA